MSNLIAIGACLGVFLSAILGGRWAARRLPEHLSDEDTKDSIRRSTGLLVTFCGLVLGVLVANGKGSFDKQSDAVANMAARVAQLDELLLHYGPGAAPVREALRGSLLRTLPALWDGQGPLTTLIPDQHRDDDGLYVALRALSPANDAEASLRLRATQVADALSLDRFQLAILQATRVSTPLLLAVVGWLAALFLANGFCSAGTWTALAADVVTAVCAAAALLLILEFDDPFSGLLRTSRVPVDIALLALQRQ